MMPLENLKQRVGKVFGRDEKLTKDEERRLLAVVQRGERVYDIIHSPDWQEVLYPILKSLWQAKYDEAKRETDPLKRAQLIGNYEFFDDFATELSEIISRGNKASTELSNKRTKNVT